MPAGISPASILKLVRETRAAPAESKPLRLYGERADELAAALASGGNTGLVRLGGDPTDAAAVVACVPVGATLDPAALNALRAADLRGVPIVAARIDGTDGPVPYVLATDVVAWPQGSPPPVEQVAARLAAGLRRDGRVLAGELPVLRPAVEEQLVTEASVQGAAIVAAPWIQGAALPVLSALQAQLLLDLDVARGVPPPTAPDELGLAVGRRVGLATAVGLTARGVYRSLPLPLRRLAGPLLAYAGTRGVAALEPRLPLRR